MYVIGITGGVGAGKSEVLKFLKDSCNCKIVLADDVGNEVKKKGQECYEKLVSLLGQELLQENGEIDKEKMAKMIFQDTELLEKVNRQIHPAVKNYILNAIEEERKRGKIDFFFLEAALLIEAGYRTIVDEIWYIYANEPVRRKRLEEIRGYDTERIEGIMSRQLSEKEFRDASDRTIDNSGSIENMKLQVETILGDPLWKVQK